MSLLQWYFCSTAAANDGAVGFDPTDTSLHFDGEMECLALPMQTAGRNVYICSTVRGARPGYSE